MLQDHLLKKINDLNQAARKKSPKQTFDFLKMLPLIEDDMSELQPFVFESTDEPAQDIPKADTDILATPFELFSIELEDIALTCSEYNPNVESLVNMQALICKEISPTEYVFWMMNKVTSLGNDTTQSITMKVEKGGVTLLGKNDVKKPNDEIYNSCIDILNIYIKRIHSEKMGLFNANGRAKLKTKNGKKVYRPKNVIYVTPKKSEKYKQEKSVQGKKIDWKSIFFVRGHWRRLINPESIGKNRQGERVVKGFTFVGEYKKGEGQLLTKIRRIQ